MNPEFEKILALEKLKDQAYTDLMNHWFPRTVSWLFFFSLISIILVSPLLMVWGDLGVGVRTLVTSFVVAVLLFFLHWLYKAGLKKAIDENFEQLLEKVRKEKEKTK